MSSLNFLYKDRYAINDSISIMIPTVGEVLEQEDNYYSIVTLLTAAPIDMMLLLDDNGIDFTKLNDYQLFLMLFQGMKGMDTSLVFGDLNLELFELAINEQNGTTVLIDRVNDIMIDRSIHGQIAAALRKIHHLKRDNRKPANKEAQEFMLERARAKARRQRNVQESQLESLIVALVNTEQYKYDFERTRELSIYQFNESARQVIHKIDYDNKMLGVYMGTIDAKKLSKDELDWTTHK